MKLTPPEHPEDPTNQPTFERLYICLGACKRGFVTGCRPLIGLGGCHLKAGQAGQTGQLLCAVGIDANNQMFPVAYAVVEGETELLVVVHSVAHRRHWHRESTWMDIYYMQTKGFDACIGGACATC